jgi:O-acetyl-ADP-ribose deacetylase (regulator of RNase III)
MLRVTLCDIDAALVEAWRSAFDHIDAVTVVRQPIFECTGDAIVSPANSFGYMDGGIDLVYSQHFGWHVEDRVRQRILDEHDGELIVGTALVVPTDDAQIPYLISAPTMRVPMVVAQRVNAYLAFRAALKVARQHPDIEHVICPGLGTGVGQLPPQRCARQMVMAWANIIEGQRHEKGGLASAVRYNHMLMME